MALSDVSRPRSRVVVAGCAAERFLVSFPVACFSLTLATDIIYWCTAFEMWRNFSSWLLFAGLLFGAFAAILRIAGFIIRREYRARPLFWPYAIGNALVLLLALVNSFVHAADGWTAVVPAGIILSFLTVLVMLVTGLLGTPGLILNREGAGSYD